jgi:thiol-disulfide isomerase/thioredoxin
MGKADRNRQQSVRQRIAAQQAAARRAERRRRILLAGGAVIVVVAIVVAIVAIKLNSGQAKAPAGSTTGTLLPASVTKDVTSVPVSTLVAVGEGSVLSYNPAPVTKISGTALTSGGKPEMLYIGAEFCPYCAAMRWSMAVALSRFGTLSPLHGIRSSSTDVFPNTATLTFYKSSYTSNYLVFTPVENETITHAPLQNTTPQQQAIWQKYEPDPNTRGYPFIDFGNKYLIKGPIYDPGLLAGKTWAQIAAALRDPSSPIARGVIGAANVITAAICTMTGNQPAAVCASPMITGLQAKL